MAATETKTVEPTATAGGPVLVGAHTHDGATGTPPERFTSSDPDDFAVPNGREEEWRFTPLRSLRILFQPLAEAIAPAIDVSAGDEVEVRTITREDEAFGSVLRPADRVSALAFAQSKEALLIRVPRDTAVAEPVVADVRGRSGAGTAHLVIDLQDHARATIVLQHSGSTTLAANVEVRVGDGAALDLVTVQEWAPDAIHVATHSALVGRDASFRHTSVNLGGKLVRISPIVRFAGPGGRAELRGVSFADGGQHHESRLYVDHNQPDCSSDVLYKNALQGEGARTVWIGDVRIRPAAMGTETFELNRNLVLTDGARADSVPNLEIETGEIAGAGHASATGRFDDLQLFYLQARGIPEAEARRLVVRGFFADVIDRLGLPELQQRLMHTIEQRLGSEAAA